MGFIYTHLTLQQIVVTIIILTPSKSSPQTEWSQVTILESSKHPSLDGRLKQFSLF